MAKKKRPARARRATPKTRAPKTRAATTRRPRPKPKTKIHVVKRRARQIVVRRRKAARPTKLVRARGKRAKHRQANRRAGQVKRHAKTASVISRETRARRTTAGAMTVASVGRKGADPLQIQVTAKFRLPAGMTPSAKLVREAIAYRIEHGHDAPGVTTAIVRWRNPARKDPAKRAWREGDQDAAWQTLGNALRAWSAAA